MTKTTNYLLHV